MLTSPMFPLCSHRPRSTLTRGSTRVSSRPGTANPPSIEEADEDVQQSDSNPELTDAHNLLTVDMADAKMSEIETVSDLDPHTEVGRIDRFSCFLPWMLFAVLFLLCN